MLVSWKKPRTLLVWVVFWLSLKRSSSVPIFNRDHRAGKIRPPSQAGVRPFCSLLVPSLKLRTTRSHEENDACQSPASEMSPSDAARHASFGIVVYGLKRQFLHFHKVHLCRSGRPCLWYLPKWEQTSPLVKVFWIPRGMKTIIEEELTMAPLNSSNSCSTGVKTSKTKPRNLELQKNRCFFFGKSLSLDCVQDWKRLTESVAAVRGQSSTGGVFLCMCFWGRFHVIKHFTLSVTSSTPIINPLPLTSPTTSGNSLLTCRSFSRK